MGGLVLVAYAMFRIQSRNLGARARENEAFLKALGPARPWVQNPRAAWTELRSYKHDALLVLQAARPRPAGVRVACA